MGTDDEVLRLECLKLAVNMCMTPLPLAGGGTLQFRDPVAIAKQFIALVLGEGTDEDDSELAPQVRAFTDEGQEL